MKYRVETLSEREERGRNAFEVESDEEAKQRFERIKEDLRHKREFFILMRIDQEERRTDIATGYR